jgi:hypothetical protein
MTTNNSYRERLSVFECLCPYHQVLKVCFGTAQVSVNHCHSLTHVILIYDDGACPMTFHSQLRLNNIAVIVAVVVATLLRNVLLVYSKQVDV